MDGSLEGQVALVTGGTRGIGVRIAASLAASGAEVVLTGRDEAAARTAAEALRGDDRRVHGLALDLGDEASVVAAVSSLKQSYAKISILVNNAGITRDNLLMRMKQEDWDSVLEANLTGVYRLCRALVPSMVRARFGRIVNVSSVVAALGNPGQTNYAAAKAGIEGFSRSLARELASRNITVNCVAPGFIDTEMSRAMAAAAREKMLSQIPMGRPGNGDDVAAAVHYLVGPGANYVTGITLNVSGGMLM